MGCAGAFNFAIFVVRGEFVSGVGLHGDNLVDASLVDARAVEADGKRAMASMEITGVESKRDAGLLAILPIETAVKDVKAEVAIDDEVVRGRQVGVEAEQGSG